MKNLWLKIKNFFTRKPKLQLVSDTPPPSKPIGKQSEITQARKK